MYSAHGALYTSGNIIELGCCVHCRRRFFEIAEDQQKPGLAAQAPQWIAKSYAFESRIKDQALNIKLATRQSEALPALTQFRQRIEANSIGLLPRTPLGQAFNYALRHWDALIRNTESGVVLPGNTALERQIRPIALGRSNWFFADSPRGAQATDTMYSLIGTARRNGIEPHAWRE